MTFRQLLVPVLLGLAWAGQAWAGRPLATDDAGTAEPGRCQLEAWPETAGQSEHALAFAPACGMAEGVEFGADYALLTPREPMRAEGGLALKWVPQGGVVAMDRGDLSFGIKLAAAYAQLSTGEWQASDNTALLLGTYRSASSWNLHANFGVARDRTGGETARLLSLALTWEPHALWLLFVETQRNDRRDVFGENVQAVGLRYWLHKDQFGLDLTASRSPGSETLWTAGFGWYGIGRP